MQQYTTSSFRMLLLLVFPDGCCTAQELLSKFHDKKVDFAAHTQTEDGGAVFFNLLGMLCWHVLHLRLHIGQEVIRALCSII